MSQIQTFSALQTPRRVLCFGIAGRLRQYLFGRLLSTITAEQSAIRVPISQWGRIGVGRDAKTQKVPPWLGSATLPTPAAGFCHKI